MVSAQPLQSLDQTRKDYLSFELWNRVLWDVLTEGLFIGSLSSLRKMRCNNKNSLVSFFVFTPTERRFSTGDVRNFRPTFDDIQIEDFGVFGSPGEQIPPRRSGGSWDRATEQQRADAELNARDATINGVTALQPWTPTVTPAECHRSAGTWPHRHAEICVQSDRTSCRCHFPNITFPTQRCNLCRICQAQDTHVARVPEKVNPSCRCTTSTLYWGIRTRPGSRHTRPPS